MLYFFLKPGFWGFGGDGRGVGRGGALFDAAPARAHLGARVRPCPVAAAGGLDLGSVGYLSVCPDRDIDRQSSRLDCPYRWFGSRRRPHLVHEATRSGAV